MSAMPLGPKTLGILLFEGFELLDVFGPAEMFCGLGDPPLRLVMVAGQAGEVRSAQGARAVADVGFDECPRLDMLLVPGGIGTRKAVNDERLLSWLREQAAQVEILMTVCTGSGLAAKAGVLDGKRATSNKKSFGWASSNSDKVQWVRQARWVEDGNRVSSSGVSAGMDMALAVIARLYGLEAAETIANYTEYEWRRDASWDPFAALYE